MGEQSPGAAEERERFLRVWQRVTKGRESVPAAVTIPSPGGAEQEAGTGPEQVPRAGAERVTAAAEGSPQPGLARLPAPATQFPRPAMDNAPGDGFLRAALEELARWRGLCCRWRCLSALDCPMERLQRRLAARLYLSAGEICPLRRVLPQGDMDERTACRVLYRRLRQGEAAFRGRGDALGEAAARQCAAWAGTVERRVAQLM